MKIALAGKGGTGKTTLAGVMARDLARRGMRVVALDVDPNPTLAMTLGVTTPEMAEVTTIREQITAFDDDDVLVDVPAMTTSDLVAQFAVEAPDGVLLIVAGRIDHVEGR